MYARVSRVQIKPGALDSAEWKEGMERFREITVAQKKEGGKGGYALVDRTANMVMSISLWESEAAMKASEAAHMERGKKRNPLRVGPGITEHYEIVVQV